MGKTNILMILGALMLVVMITSIVLFNPHGNITGNDVATRVEIMPAARQNCTIPLDSGWNFISIYCLGSWESINESLDSIQGKYSRVFHYSVSDTNDHWKSYNPMLPAQYVQQLNHMDRTKGYWIHMRESAQYNYEGYLRFALIPLYPGWNMLGYTSNTSMLINDTGLWLTDVITYNSSSAQYLVYVNGSSGNTLNEFTPFRGYWINSSATQNWNIPSG